MIRFTRAVPLAALVSATLVSAACRPKPVVDTAPGPVVTVNQDSINRAEAARRDSIARAEEARRQAERARFVADSIASARARMESSAAELRNSMVAEIHFDFDQAEILDQDRTLLDRKAAILQANPNVRISIAGHADERGSDEYNMALGQRRAAAGKRYLESRGVASGRIDIVSFGEERPICEGHEESCWAQNRRGDFAIVSGGDMLTAPRE